MSVARARCVFPLRHPSIRSIFSSRRVHSEHADYHGSATADEPTRVETFATPAWRNTLIAGVVLYGIYTLMPSASDGNAITKFISTYYTPSTVWAEMNTERTMAHTHFAEGKLLSQSAERPVIQRSRFPSLLDQASPRNVGVGENVDVTNFVVKRDGQ